MSWKLLSCSLTHLSLSCLVILQVLSISGLLCSHTSSPRVSLCPCRYFSREKPLQRSGRSSLPDQLQQGSTTRPFILSYSTEKVAWRCLLPHSFSRFFPTGPLWEDLLWGRRGEDSISFLSSSVHLFFTSQNKFMLQSDLRFPLTQSRADSFFFSFVFYSWFKWNHNRNRSTPGFIFLRVSHLCPASLH